MKKSKLLLLPLLLFSFVSCGEAVPEDKDFDGLLNEVDPDPNNNEYVAKFKKPSESDEYLTNDYHFYMDYRELIYENYPTFNPNTCKIGAMITTESNQDREVAHIQNNPYFDENSKILKIFGQLGIQEAERKELHGDNNFYDDGELFIGNHKMNYNNQKYQFFFATIRAYFSNDEWSSNFDIGADTENYYEVNGEDLSEWKNRKEHKGFSITAERMFVGIKDYIERKRDASAQTYLILSGQSRSGAVVELAAKKASDLLTDIKTTAYCLNPSKTTTESDKSVLRSYKNIFNVICDEDITSCIPPEQWGFDNYGLMYHYSNYDPVIKAEYERLLKKEYVGIPIGANDAISEFLSRLIKSREDVYEFRTIDEIETYPGYLTEYEAEEEAEDLRTRITDESGAKSVDAYVFYDEDDETYTVQYMTRPCVLIYGSKRVVISLNDEYCVQKIIEAVTEYLPFTKKYLLDLTSLLEDPRIEGLSAASFEATHNPMAAIATAYFAVPLEE